jgi:hypothetical protein
MNRQHRRSLKAQARKVGLDRATAIHEAGHAVARVLTAEDMGLPPDEAVAYITIGERHIPRGTSIDGKMHLLSLATTYGPTFSREIDQYKGDPHEKGITNAVYCERTVAAAKAAGVSMEPWLRASSLFIMFASVAEAKYLGKPFMDVWWTYESESDGNDFIRNINWAGLDDKAAKKLMESTLARAHELIEQPDVWRAVLAIADRLPNKGRVEGTEVARIVLTALAQQTH